MLVNIFPNIYMCSMTISFLIYILYFILNLRKTNVPLWHLCLSGIFILLVSILGGRLMWAIENISYITVNDIFSLRFGNWRLVGVFIFNIISILLVTYIYYKYYNVSISQTLTIVLEAVFLEFALNKLCCFLEGCCYGVETTLPWGMIFDNSGIHRHPTQLYEFISFSTIFILLRLTRNKFNISIKFSFATTLYIITRLLVEPIREEANVYSQGPTKYIYYILLFICIVIILTNILCKLQHFKSSK